MLTILNRNQLILRLTEMHVVSEETGEKATVSVQQKIPLVAPGAKKAVRRAATLQPMPRHQTPSFLNQEVQARPVSGTMQPPPKPSQRIDVPRSSTRLEDAIKSQQRDIDRISGAVARIEKDMDSFQEFMVEMRAELEANRVTRKTQQESNREQLAWLQEDLNELRQENGEFQQDLREEELPDIKNKLEQLQQEIDSQGHITGLPNEDRPPASVNEFQREVLYIRRKCNQVDGVKAELQRLQKRLNDMEGKRRNSFVFPRTLMTPNQPSHAGSRMTSMPTIAQQRPRMMMLQAPEDDGAQSRMTRHISPSRNPPGAFSDSIVESGPTSRRMTTQAATITATSSARTRRTTGRQDIANVAETATPKPLITQRWSYTGFRHWKTLRAAFEAFELEYPKLGIPESAKILEDHVNNSNLQSTAFASQYGEVTIVEERNENVEHRDPSESNHLETSPLKRKHGQVEGNTEELASGAIKKKRGHTSRTGEKQPTDPDKILRSPRLTTSSPRLSIPEHRVVGLISSDEGSPELGRDSPFGEVPSELANSDHIPRNEYDEGNVDRIAPPAQSNVSNEEKAKPVHQHRRSRDQLGVLPLNTVPITPASRSRNTGSSPNTNALLMTLESNEAVIPGAFPSYLTDEDVAPNAGPSDVKTDAIVYDPRTDSSKHFRCGSCGKKYRNPTALKYVSWLPCRFL